MTALHLFSCRMEEPDRVLRKDVAEGRDHGEEAIDFTPANIPCSLVNTRALLVSTLVPSSLVRT